MLKRHAKSAHKVWSRYTLISSADVADICTMSWLQRCWHLHLTKGLSCLPADWHVAGAEYVFVAAAAVAVEVAAAAGYYDDHVAAVSDPYSFGYPRTSTKSWRKTSKAQCPPMFATLSYVSMACDS